MQPVVVMKRPYDDVADHPELCSDHARNRFSSAFMRGIHRRLLSKAIEHNEDNRHDFVGTQLSSTATLSATATPEDPWTAHLPHPWTPGRLSERPSQT